MRVASWTGDTRPVRPETQLECWGKNAFLAGLGAFPCIFAWEAVVLELVGLV